MDVERLKYELRMKISPKRLIARKFIFAPLMSIFTFVLCFMAKVLSVGYLFGVVWFFRESISNQLVLYLAVAVFVFSIVRAFEASYILAKEIYRFAYDPATPIPTFPLAGGRSNSGAGFVSSPSPCKGEGRGGGQNID